MGTFQPDLLARLRLATLVVAVVVVGLVGMTCGSAVGAQANSHVEAGMPGLVQISSAAWPTPTHGFVLIEQCDPCQARGGTYRSWEAVTTDAGRVWTVRASPLAVDSHVTFADGANGWGTGAHNNPLVSHDGGLNWLSASTDQPWGIDSISAAGGAIWAEAAGVSVTSGTVILEGTASGDALRPVSDQPFTGFVPGQAIAVNRSDAYVDVIGAPAGRDRLGTTNGGRSWRPLAPPCPHGYTSRGFLAADGADLWDICEQLPPAGHRPPPIYPQEIIARSTDAGRSWGTHPVGTRLFVGGLEPVGPGVAWASCKVTDICRTTDGGAHWPVVWSQPPTTVGTPEALTSSSPDDAEEIVAVTSQHGPADLTSFEVFVTTDGGAHWSERALLLPDKA